jgi:CRP/FNR family cyclic AMP-dependent transcriptional regulator
VISEQIAQSSLWGRVQFLAGVGDEPLAALAAAATRYTYEQGQTIFLEGEPVAGIYLIDVGVVKICRYAIDGREHILVLLNAGETFNDVAALDGGPNPACAVAFTDVVVWRVTRSDLKHIVIRYPALAWALIENLAGRTRHLLRVVQDLAARNVRGRLARLLLEQAAASEVGGAPLPLTQEEMAALLGTVREVIGRTLRSLVADGLIAVERQHIVIVDRAGLELEAQA